MGRRGVTKAQQKLAEELATRGIGYAAIPEDEYLRKGAARKRKLGIFHWPDFGKLKYPGWVTVHMDYFATGEGSTRGIAVCACPDRASLERYIVRTFGSYYSQDVELREGIRPLPGYENLIPPLAQALLNKARRKQLGGILEFHAQLHVNYS
jgi:hypothetical protein